jgi:hypothetical protein
MEYVGVDVAKDKLGSLWLQDRKSEKLKTKIHRNTKWSLFFGQRP